MPKGYSDSEVPMDELIQNDFKKGLRDGIPICLGYISVSFTFGMMAVSDGLPAWAAVLISASNVTSAGQFAALDIIVALGTFFELALTQFVINLRYALMSLSWSQKLDPSVKLWQRLIIAFVDTDEIFALSSSLPGTLGFKYMLGLGLTPVAGWVGGTALGALASSLLPASISSALGVAIYGMFLAIIIPPARKKLSVRTVVIIAVILSCILHYTPGLNHISSGFAIIICAVAASAFGAVKFPVKGDPNLEEED